MPCHAPSLLGAGAGRIELQCRVKVRVVGVGGLGLLGVAALVDQAHFGVVFAPVGVTVAEHLRLATGGLGCSFGWSLAQLGFCPGFCFGRGRFAQRVDSSGYVLQIKVWSHIAGGARGGATPAFALDDQPSSYQRIASGHESILAERLADGCRELLQQGDVADERMVCGQPVQYPLLQLLLLWLLLLCLFLRLWLFVARLLHAFPRGVLFFVEGTTGCKHHSCRVNGQMHAALPASF